MTRLDKAVTAAITEVKKLQAAGTEKEIIIEKLEKIEDPIIRRLIIAEGLGYNFLE